MKVFIASVFLLIFLTLWLVFCDCKWGFKVVIHACAEREEKDKDSPLLPRF